MSQFQKLIEAIQFSRIFRIIEWDLWENSYVSLMFLFKSFMHGILSIFDIFTLKGNRNDQKFKNSK